MKLLDLFATPTILEGEAVLKSMTSIFHVMHHVYFIQVTYNNDGVQVPVNDPYGRLDNITPFNDECLRTVKVPGYEGDFVCVVFPAAV